MNLLKRVKATYYGSLKPASICDNKNFWKTVKPLFSGKCVTTDSIALVENKEIVSDDKEVATIFNNFFSGAVKSLNLDYFEHFSFDCIYSESEDPILNAIEKYSKHPSIVKIKQHYPPVSSFSFKPTNLQSVLKEVMNLDASKSSPLESLPARIIKDISDVICPKIVIDFNSSIATGIFPQHLKLADVIPVFKKGIKESKGNYRPVSLLSAMSKVFERLMKQQTNDYMKTILSIFLCGFTK